jgi:hypothetical protein
MTEIVDPASSDRRRNWGLIMLAGGGMAMTAYAAAALWLVRDDRDYAFYLGAGALGLVGVVLTGFSALLVKRTFRVSRDGLDYSDQGSVE